MMERDYVGLSEASSAAREAEEEEIELGLSLGAKKVTADKSKAAAAGWGRILTAKDFPAAMGSRASPLSSSSSVSSSEGTKRVADSDGAASNNPPSQALVGWPPIRAFRINNTSVNKDNTSDAEAIANKKNNHNDDNKNDRIATKNRDNRGCGNSNVGVTRFIKVNMDGDPIGRKVDLNAHQSYEALALSLEMMFHKPTTCLSSSAYCAKASKLLDGSSEFALTYEDKDGDWMLVGDVPWGMFMDTVKRLRIMRASDANGLTPRFQSSDGGLLRSNPN